MGQWGVVAVVVLAGAAVALQGAVNGALSRGLGGALPAAAVSFLIGALVLLALTLLTLGTAPFARLAAVPPLHLAGGFLGAFYVWSVAWGVPQMGVLTTAAALVLGQMVAALLLDASGALGLAAQAITPRRLAAAALVAMGLILSRS